MHHPATDRIGEGLVVTGSAADGIAEVVEDPNNWVLGVLWHPEQALDRTPIQRRLYQALIDAARKGAA
jgi:putative glutamine amidotransferase